MIYTSRLLLLPFSEQFLTKRYISWLNDKHLMQFSEQRHRIHTEASCRNYWRIQLSSDNLFLAITKIDDNSHIGNITVAIDPHNSSADIGILIGEKSEIGQGYGCEAWNGVMGYLFQDRSVRKITGGAMATNTPMINIFVKSGMKLEATRPNHYVVKGPAVAVVYYSADFTQWTSSSY